MENRNQSMKCRAHQPLGRFQVDSLPGTPAGWHDDHHDGRINLGKVSRIWLAATGFPPVWHTSSAAFPANRFGVPEQGKFSDRWPFVSLVSLDFAMNFRAVSVGWKGSLPSGAIFVSSSKGTSAGARGPSESYRVCFSFFVFFLFCFSCRILLELHPIDGRTNAAPLISTRREWKPASTRREMRLLFLS